LALAGQEDDAEQSYRHALGLDPDSAEAHFGLGLMAVSQGRLDDGIGEFRQSLEKRPGFAQAWQQILEARRIEKEDDADLVSVREALQQPALSADDRESLNYALGKACDDLDQYKEAFSHFEAANRLKRQRLPAYDRVELERSTDALITASLADDRSDEVASGGILPVFVIGLPRSGTTLIDQILTSHPQAAGLGESPFFQAALAGKSDGEWETITPDAIDDLRSRYLRLLDTVGGSVATNKYPANFRLVGLIKKVLPEARFVHVTRDPLDTCVSIFFQDFPSGNHYANDMEDLASYLAAYTRLMEHWREVLADDSLLELSYEALLDDQQRESRRLLSFCGLDWDPICLDYADNSRRVSTLSRWQVRQPLYKTSLDRWKNYQDHLGVLIETVAEPAVNDVSG
jgi:tetratricopeptide (TPR) repeat protein